MRFNHLDLFSYIREFNEAANAFALAGEEMDIETALNGVMADPAAFAKRVHLLCTGGARTTRNV